ncbi:MAG: rRNA (guanosine2251-2-O)-methyltransferase [Actinomycetota bacterium]|nr:rRNA (guanosine2251-2-O)-methyltransferase [Actinomycetota bacterium]
MRVPREAHPLTPRGTQGSRGPAETILSGRRPVLELLRNHGAAEKIFFAEGLAPSKVLGEIRRRAKEVSVPVAVVPKREIERLAGDVNHQGVVAKAGRYRYASIDDLLHETSALLFVDGVTDPHNLGSLLRSADGAGFTGLVVPAHRAVGVTPAVRRVSAGAAEVVRVARVANMSQALDEARRAGLWILGLDEKSERDLWGSDLAQPPVGLVLGSEDRGISRLVREHCDDLVRIPFFGKIGSLNVAVAGAVAMFEVARRRDSARL